MIRERYALASMPFIKTEPQMSDAAIPMNRSRLPLLVKRPRSIGNALGAMLAIVARPLLFAVYGLSGWMPRERNLWVFGSWDGRRYADNAAALFEFACQQSDEKIKPVWITRSPEVLHLLRQRKPRVYSSSSLSGIWYCLRAGVYVFDGHTKDINHWLSRGALRVHLQHGPGGYKAIERDIIDTSHSIGAQFYGNRIQTLLYYLLRPWHATPLHLVVTASEQQSLEAQSAYAVGADRVIRSGLPRNDVFYRAAQDPGHEPELRAWIEEAKARGGIVIAHMPTFRDDGSQPFAGFWESYESVLAEQNMYCISHQHYVAGRGALTESCSTRGHLWRLDARVDIHPLLPLTDVLVTDFCSVAFDYLLLEKPVIYFIPDYHEYLDHCRQLRFPFEEVAVGPLVLHKMALMDALVDLRTLKPLPQRYYEIRDRFHEQQNGGSSERVFKKMLALTQQEDDKDE